jgi:other hect domain ubiquitin protein ligase E3
LEDWVCGKPDVDIKLLKRHTKYSGGLAEDSPRVIWFWEILENEFNEEELSKFIKFSWGQERLPSNEEEYLRNHTRLMIKPSMNTENKDGALPRADTCFFNLELPDYSSKDILRNKLRYAFLTDCESMNADNPLSEQQEAGMYREDHYSGDEE